MKLKKLALAALAATTVVSVASCGDSYKNGVLTDGKNYTYNDYTSVCPSNWNELTYQDANDTQIMSFISGSFFSFDYLFDGKDIVPGKFDLEYSAATKIEDVTTKYAGNAKYSVPADAKDAYAYKITLRNDLKWDDGTKITADDFVYTMKEQLDPAAMHYRSDSFYVGSTIIANAKNYIYQGQSNWYAGDTAYASYSEDLDSKLVFSLAPKSDDVPAQASFRDAIGFPASYNAAMTAAYLCNAYLGGTAFTVETAAAMEGKTLAEIKADATMKAAWEALIGWWQTEPDEELDFFVTYYTWEETDFSEVGLFVGNKENELIIVLDKQLDLIDEDGKMNWKVAYNMSSLPLVHRAKWEANKVQPDTEDGLVTSTYCSSVESSASWGPYKLTEFVAGDYYVLERNENWYGYNMKQYDGQYQTDKIYVEVIKEYNTQLQKFLAGELAGIGIDVSVADQYKNSEQAIYTPDDYVGSLQLQSNAIALKNREADYDKAYPNGVDKEMLTYTEFRKAISLSINRAEYTKACTTASLPGFGLFNSMHYYDVANGGVYRNEDVAKEVLCEIYGVDADKFDSIDEAVATITGYNPTLAKQLVTEAYNKAVAAGTIDADDTVVITFGTSVINEVTLRRFNWLTTALKEMVVGTPLEGRLETEQKDFSTGWANDFRDGAYDVCEGGWSGAAWDPGYFLLAYLSPEYMYSQAWDTSSVMMEFTMPGVGEDGEDVTDTLSLLDWYGCLNGDSAAPYNWSAGEVEETKRLLLIAALEKEILSVYYTVPLLNSFGASLISYKFDYITREYNTFMGYGGIRYIKYNYTDEEWEAYVKEQGGTLNYSA